MKTNTKSVWKTKKIYNNRIIEESPSVVAEKKASVERESNVSIFTKTTNPKVIVQSENIKFQDNSLCKDWNKHKFVKIMCMVIMCIILLITFFMSLKTY